jgi:hypothetical protein
MTVVLDAGALVAIDKRDRRVGAMLRLYQEARVPVLTSNAVVAQVWRNGRRQANLARVLNGLDRVPLDAAWDTRVGELLAAAGGSDVVDGHVALLVSPDDKLLTSDVDDLRPLLDVRRVNAEVVAI